MGAPGRKSAVERRAAAARAQLSVVREYLRVVEDERRRSRRIEELYSARVVASTATRWYGEEGKILRFVFVHSIVLATLVGLLVLLQAYVPPFTSMVAPVCAVP